MQCLARQPPSIKARSISINIDSLHLHGHQHHHFSTSCPSLKQLRQVPFLSSWTPDAFEREAYIPSTPARIPRSAEHLPPACWKWFIHDNDADFVLTSTATANEDDGTGVNNKIIHYPTSSELRTSFWSDYESTVVPLEITSKVDERGEHANEETFHRIEAPLKVLLSYLSRPTMTSTAQTQQSNHDERSMSIYLAQCDLTSLPPSVTDDIPTPLPLINTDSSSRSGLNSRFNLPSSSSSPGRSHDYTKSRKGLIKGDIYASSLWLGRPPTYTPLHRDPNPNLFVQLAGRKVIRLLPPEVGGALFEDVQRGISQSPHSHHLQSSSSTIRGEEMMVGPEKRALHDAVWSESNSYSDIVRTYGFETDLKLGDFLFIPKGWWHSVNGVGQGITASVNWWFR